MLPSMVVQCVCSCVYVCLCAFFCLRVLACFLWVLMHCSFNGRNEELSTTQHLSASTYVHLQAQGQLIFQDGITKGRGHSPTSMRVRSCDSSSRCCLRASWSLRSRITNGAVPVLAWDKLPVEMGASREPPPVPRSSVTFSSAAPLAARLILSCSFWMSRSFSRFCIPIFSACLLNHFLCSCFLSALLEVFGDLAGGRTGAETLSWTGFLLPTLGVFAGVTCFRRAPEDAGTEEGPASCILASVYYASFTTTASSIKIDITWSRVISNTRQWSMCKYQRAAKST